MFLLGVCLLILRTAVATTGSGILAMLAQVDFKGTITLGSLVVALLVAALAGVFTIRAKVATTWREEAQAEKWKAERLERELQLARSERLNFDREQQQLRHELKNELAATKAALEVERSKHDLGHLLTKTEDLAHAQTVERMEMFSQMTSRQDKIIELITQLIEARSI